jgi:hypothetical protein
MSVVLTGLVVALAAAGLSAARTPKAIPLRVRHRRRVVRHR